MAAAVLFDLDGTLLDTAPDLVFALNSALDEAGLPLCDPIAVKPFISGGARSMLGYALGSGGQQDFIPDWTTETGPPEFGPEAQALLHRVWDIYEANLTERTWFFAGMDRVLNALEARHLPWGIVTNKTRRFTEPLANALNLWARTDCIISGDSTAEKKPHPLPLLEASRQLGVNPEQCVYIGDAAKDMLAGRRAGMTTLVALYGYIAAHDEPAQWGADGMLEAPLDLLDWLDGELP